MLQSCRRLQKDGLLKSISWSWLLLLVAFVVSGRCMSSGQMKEMRQEAERMFYHGFENYVKYGFPEDELRPLSCKPLTRDRGNPAHFELNDVLGNYSLTLIDSLSTLAILASSPSVVDEKKNKALGYFQTGIAALVKQYGDGSKGSRGRGVRCRGFDLDSKVQVFETVIRGVGGLLSGHLFAIGDLPIRGYEPDKNSVDGEVIIKWPRDFVYDGQLLRLAHDLGRRLLPAFHTATGLPYPRVNLRHGIPFYANSPLNYDAENGQCQTTQKPATENTETCSAGAGTLLLEFITLSRLTGDSRFEEVAKKAFWAIWERRGSTGLVGSGIDAETGHWTSSYTGIGAGIDSFFEYAAKSYILLSRAPLPEASVIQTETNSFMPPISAQQQSPYSFLEVWRTSQSSIKRHLYRGHQFVHPHYVQGDLFTGATRAFWFDSLSAFYPGLLTLMGEVNEATETHLLNTALWTRYSALPERWSTSSGGIEGGLAWWGGRPEFIESTYHLYRATRDPWYLHVGEMTLRDIKRRCWAKCGWAGIQDVRTGELNDRMESFFLGETAKYLFLLFDPDHPLNRIDAPFVFSTEGHPLILPKSRSRNLSALEINSTHSEHSDEAVRVMCPLPPPSVPFSISATAARKDLYHAANLARLHLMPTPETIESPIIDYSRDHPSISISDVRSPSNYTYFPWTLPPELVPHDGTCSKITAKTSFDITFPASPNTVLGPGILQRVLDGVLVTSMGGVRFGLIQDVPTVVGSDLNRELYRVHAINNVLLGKDERVFLAKETASKVVSPVDPSFTRVRDPTMLDIVIDVAERERFEARRGDHEAMRGENPAKDNETSLLEPELDLLEELEDSLAAAGAVINAFNSLLQQIASLIREPSPATPQVPTRKYLAAIIPSGPGAAPLPDVEDTLGPDVTGSPQGSLIWKSIFLAGDNCNSRLPIAIPKHHQVIVIMRGGCSFTQKLENIPIYLPSESSLQLVIVVSADEGGDDDDHRNLPPGYLVRPWLEGPQHSASGLPRHHPIPMVMVGGGRATYESFRAAGGVGVKRRYSMQARGVPISNVIVI